MEQWAEIGEPSVLARLAQVRALLELCSVERAWSRLEPLLDEANGAEVFRLAGRLLLDRGELNDARAAIQRGRKAFPDDTSLAKLLDATEEPGTVIDRTEPVMEDANGLAMLAERLLVEGAPLKARRLLERIRKKNPEHNRTADLLWALDGNFALRGVTLTDLARVHAAPTQSLADLPDDTDQTMEADPEELAASAAFPTLFKNLEERTEVYGGKPEDEPEVTRVTHMEEVAESEVTQDSTDANPPLAGREDTQIMHVVRTTGPSNDQSSAETLVDATFDLRAHEHSLEGESEDENVVVHRKAPPDRTITETDADGDRIRLDPSRERVQSGANSVDEAAEFIRPRKKPQVTVEPAPPRAKPAPPHTSDPPRSGSDAGRPRLQAAPSTARSPDKKGVALKRIPTDERPRLDPALAAAPTEIIEDPNAPSRMPSFAPWTGWLLVLGLLGLGVMGMGSLLILYQVVASR